MSESPAETPEMHARLVALEELLTHLQATVQTLSTELYAQGRQLDSLKRDALRMQQLVAETSAKIVEVRRPEDEKPPHY